MGGSRPPGRTVDEAITGDGNHNCDHTHMSVTDQRGQVHNTVRGEKKTVGPPHVGELELDCDVLSVHGADPRIVVYTAAPGSEAGRGCRRVMEHALHPWTAVAMICGCTVPPSETWADPRSNG
jgi:hypothetical protein